jgi:hypothetical protein
MDFQQYQVPFEVEYLQRPGPAPTPVWLEVDFDSLLNRRPAYIDLSSIRAEMDGRLVSAQFTPAEEFDALERCRGAVGLLLDDGGIVRRGLLSFAAAPPAAEDALRLPYPPHSHRRVLPDGRIAPPIYLPSLQLIPQPEGRIDVEQEGALVTSYHYRTSDPRPYLYPLIGPSGRGLTRLGHPHDPGDTHGHHRSIWVGFQKVDGENFWEERQGGRLVHQQFERLEDGAVFARILDRVHWITQDGRGMLNERRDVRVYPGADGGRLVDFTLEFRGPDDGRGTVRLDQTPFGFLGVRVAKSLGAFDGGGVIRNSEGGINEPGVFWKPARWCDYSGPISPGEWNGLAFLDSPTNPMHPTPWHVRPDGWMGAAIAAHQALQIPEGEALVLRYRLYAHPGTAQEARVEAAWHDFAYPPRAHLRGPVTAAG